MNYIKCQNPQGKTIKKIILICKQSSKFYQSRRKDKGKYFYSRFWLSESPFSCAPGIELVTLRLHMKHTYTTTPQRNL